MKTLFFCCLNLKLKLGIRLAVCLRLRLGFKSHFEIEEMGGAYGFAAVVTSEDHIKAGQRTNQDRIPRIRIGFRLVLAFLKD